MYIATHQRIIKPSLNMAVHCHLLFVIFCLYFLTANFKINTPIPCWDCNKIYNPINAFISIVKNKVTFEIPGDVIRGAALKDMGNKYRYRFLPYEQCMFMGNGVVAAPMSQMKDYIDKYSGMYSYSSSPGIPTDLDNDELYDWIFESRIVTRAFTNKVLVLNVDVDKNANPIKVAKVLHVLKTQHIDHFNYRLTSGSLEKTMFVGEIRY